jgi:hypothetical protein
MKKRPRKRLAISDLKDPSVIDCTGMFPPPPELVELLRLMRLHCPSMERIETQLRLQAEQYARKQSIPLPCNLGGAMNVLEWAFKAGHAAGMECMAWNAEKSRQELEAASV